MLQLNPEQVQRLQALKLERDVAQLSGVLAAGFTDVPGRLGERYGLLIQHGVQRGAAHGLLHAVCVGRYLACWFMLGAEFEAKPGFEWAAELLGSRQRDEGAKVFQLCRRTREELARLAAQPQAVKAALAPAEFDAAIARLDEALMPRGALGSLLPPQAVRLGSACDIDALDLRVPESAPALPSLQYQRSEGQWRRLPVAIDRQPLTLAVGMVAAKPAGGAAPGAAAEPAASPLPARLHLVAQPASRVADTATGGAARLRLRTRCAVCCDPQVHPLVQHTDSLGIATWRGPHAADVLLNLLPERGDEAATAGTLQPVTAEETPVRHSRLQLSSCGLRDQGVSLGDLTTQLSVYAGEQHLIAWRHDKGAALSLPEAHDTPPGAAALARLKIERDGLPQDAARWQAGLEDLDRQLAQGLSRLATAWERESGVSQARLEAEPQVLCGQAAITWGWAESPQGLHTAPTFRVAGLIDVVACQLNLRLSGTLNLQGSLSRLHLHCGGVQTLQQAFERTAESADLVTALAGTQCNFSLPFALDLEAFAQDALAVLGTTEPLSGAVVGSCGLRPRPQGVGLQWFAKLAVEPVKVGMQVHDPLLGTSTLPRQLLPAMTLLDWSLG